MSGELYLLGAGVSGQAAARLAASEGRSGKLISEQKPEAEQLQHFAKLGFPWLPDLPDNLQGEVVCSPGIPAEHPWFARLQVDGVDVLPEFEWASRRLQGTQIAVTGSLGKTSMVLLAAELLQDAGATVTVSGNIGIPVSEIAHKQPRADFHVLELSSFQLEQARQYRPARALCLNLFPNHLDRHQDMAEYAAAKARLFANQQQDDVAVWPQDFPGPVKSGARRVLAEEQPLPELGNTPFAVSGLRKNLQGLFAVLSGIPRVDVFAQEELIRAFRFPAHRMEQLDIPGSGRVVNDSKSTCLSATMAALQACEGPVQLVMGGLDKGEDLMVLLPELRDRNPEIYLFGRAAEKMQAAWQDSVDLCRAFDSLHELMPVLWQARTPLQTLLFSPGCASFDQFSGYAERGKHFQRLVQELATQSPITE